MSVSASDSRSPRHVAAVELLMGALGAVLVAALVGGSLGLPTAFPLLVVALYAAVCLLILPGIPRLASELGRPGLGPANRITLARLLIALPLAGLLLHPGTPDSVARWWVVGLGTLALALDGLDGWVARRTGTGSSFGARFDMETDAGLILVLSLLVWGTGQAPGWVVLMGGLRYLFVAAGWIWPALRAPLPPSMRRKTICVVQGVALVVALAPFVPAPVATTLVGIALALLCWSFAVDTAWLVRSPAQGKGSSLRAA